MKLKNKILVLLLFLVLICCLGAVSAAEDINETITADSSIDDVNTVLLKMQLMKLYLMIQIVIRE